MQKTVKKNEHAELGNRPLDLQTETKDILLLHFKQGMSFASIAHIFSRGSEEIEEICCKFAASFSQRDYMMNVVNGMAKMNQNSKVSPAPVAMYDAKDIEIAELRKKLMEAELKAELYQEMVRVAETTYQIPIRKKFGAK